MRNTLFGLLVLAALAAATYVVMYGDPADVEQKGVPEEAVEPAAEPASAPAVPSPDVVEPGVPEAPVLSPEPVAAEAPADLMVRRALAESGFAFVVITSGDKESSARATATARRVAEDLRKWGGEIGFVVVDSVAPGVMEVGRAYGVSAYPAVLALRAHGGEHFIGQGITRENLERAYLSSARPAASGCGGGACGSAGDGACPGGAGTCGGM